MKISRGTYDSSTLESNALVTNLLKYPEISKTLIRQFPQYSLTYFTEGTGRWAKESLIGHNKFEWFIQGRLNRPSHLVSIDGDPTPAGNVVAAGVQATITVEEDFLNPNDVIRLADGNQFVLVSGPVANGADFDYQAIGLNSAQSITFGAEVDVASSIVGTVGSAFPEGSKQGYENHVYPDKYVNFLTTFRKAKTVTGSALTDITWIENNGQRLWYFTDMDNVMNEFLYQKELAFWYGKSSMDATGNNYAQGIVTGDGLLAQVSGSNTANYGGMTLTEKQLTQFLADLSYNSGAKEGRYMMFTGTGGRLAFHEAMKEFVKSGSALVYDVDAGRDLTVGVNYTSYVALGMEIMLVHCPLFDDPNLHSDLDPVSGFPKESFRMVFLDMGVQNGVSNIEVKTKGAGGIDRGMIIKYLPGMVNPFDQKSMMATSAYDGFQMEMLSESGIIVRNPSSCGQLIF